jgi:hypothetical protein
MNRLKSLKFKYHTRGQGALLLQERLQRQEIELNSNLNQ